MEEQEIRARQDEQEFLRTWDPHRHGNPLAMVDIAIFTVIDRQLHVLLSKRSIYPYRDNWALPGGKVELADETIESVALRKLKARTGVDAPYLEQVGTVGNRTRDPRMWSLAVVYFALLPNDRITLAAGDGISELQWAPITAEAVPVELAFDHADLLRMAVLRLRNKCRYTMLPALLLPAEFTLTDLVEAFAAVMGEVNESLIRKRALRENLVVETGRMRQSSRRPAMLYRLADGAANHIFERVIGT